MCHFDLFIRLMPLMFRHDYDSSLNYLTFNSILNSTIFIILYILSSFWLNYFKVVHIIYHLVFLPKFL